MVVAAMVFAMVVVSTIEVAMVVAIVVAMAVAMVADPGEGAHGAHGAHGAGVALGHGAGHTPTMPIHTLHITITAQNATAVSVLQMVFA